MKATTKFKIQLLFWLLFPIFMLVLSSYLIISSGLFIWQTIASLIIAVVSGFAANKYAPKLATQIQLIKTVEQTCLRIEIDEMKDENAKLKEKIVKRRAELKQVRDMRNGIGKNIFYRNRGQNKK